MTQKFNKTRAILKAGLNVITIRLVRNEYYGGALFSMIDKETGNVLIRSGTDFKYCLIN